MISIHHHMQTRHHIVMTWNHLVMASHRRHRFHPSQYGIITPFRLSLYGIISPYLPVWHHFAILHIPLYDITASSYTFIVESCCHPILSGWHQQYHILPHHYRETHPAPSLRGITSCPIITGNHIMPRACGEHIIPHHYGDHSS
jgi:hypothetical protein